MKSADLVISTRQPWWLKLVIIAMIFAAIAALVFNEQVDASSAMVIFVFAYAGVHLILRVIVRFQPATHAWTLTQDAESYLSRRYRSYRFREFFWLGVGYFSIILIPRAAEKFNPASFSLLIVLTLLGLVTNIYWHFKGDQLKAGACLEMPELFPT